MSFCGTFGTSKKCQSVERDLAFVPAEESASGIITCHEGTNYSNRQDLTVTDLQDRGFGGV